MPDTTPQAKTWYETAKIEGANVDYHAYPMYAVQMALVEQQKRTADALEEILIKGVGAQVAPKQQTIPSADKFNSALDDIWCGGGTNADLHIQADKQVVILLKQLGYHDGALLFEAIAAERELVDKGQT